MEKEKVAKALKCIRSGKLHDYGLSIECKICPYGQLVRVSGTEYLENRVCDKKRIIEDAKKYQLIPE